MEMKTAQEYTIIFQPRCGSTLLTHFLSETNALGIPKESFSDYWVKKIYAEYGISVIDNLNGYLSIIKDLSHTENGIFGHKISLYQIEKYLDGDLFRYFKKNNLYYMTRKNKLYQAVSDFIASETNTWKKIKGQSNVLNINLKYDRKKIKSKFLYHYDNEVKVISFFQRNKVKPIRTIFYEELCIDPNSIIKQFLDDLSINYNKTLNFSLKSAKYQKQRTTKNDEFVEKFLADENEVVINTYNQLEKIGFEALFD